jgi:hypothetical protein
MSAILSRLFCSLMMMLSLPMGFTDLVEVVGSFSRHWEYHSPRPTVRGSLAPEDTVPLEAAMQVR